MDWTGRVSGGNVGPGRRASPIVLRLLAAVHHPPAKALVVGWGSGEEFQALHARGYRVDAVEMQAFVRADGHQEHDLVCEHGEFARLAGPERDAYVEAAARVLRAGGRVFGAFESSVHVPSASELITRFSRHFEVERLEPSGFAPESESTMWYEGIFVRR